MKNSPNPKKMMETIREQKKVINFLSNQEAIRGLKSALEDFKKGRYTVR